MLLLLSNDDGVDAEGLFALSQIMQRFGEVWTVAPETEQSAQSHALTLHKPLRVKERGERRFAVSGTPADCVYLALHHLLPRPPDLVISGINRGANLGYDIFYSGTFAAALEAALSGIPAIAVSLAKRPEDQICHWETATGVLADLLASHSDALREHRGRVFNVNVPNRPKEECRGLRTAILGRHHYTPSVSVRRDPRGADYYWIGGNEDEYEAIVDSDGPFVERGWATITPIIPDMTDRSLISAVRQWEQR